MGDLMRKTSLVMMAEPEGYAETEKGKNRVRSKVTGGCDTDYHFDPLNHLWFYRGVFVVNNYFFIKSTDFRIKKLKAV